LLLARLGLRAGEVRGLELADIHWRAGEIVVRGKGKTRDRLPLPQDVGEALAAYLSQDRAQSPDRHVFLRVRAPRRAIGRASSISVIVSRALQRAGLDPPLKGAYLLRHSLATEMLRGGAKMTEIAQVLRHRRLQTTEIYAKVDLVGLRALAPPWPGKGGEQ
jgi:integrase